MSTDTTTLRVEERSELGKKAKILIEQQKVPAVIHDHGKSLHISAGYSELSKVWFQAGKHAPVELDLDGKKHLTIIKEVDFEPVKHTIRHVVFGAIRKNETVETEVPIRIDGEVPAEKIGLILITQLESVQIKAFPRNLPDELTVDANKLAELGDKVTIADLVLPQGVEVLADESIPIAVVDEPRAMASAEDEADAAEEGSEESSSDEPTESSDQQAKED